MAEVRVTESGALVEYESLGVEVSLAGAWSEIEDTGEKVTHFGVLAEIASDTINVTLFGVLAEIEEVPVVATHFDEEINYGPPPHIILPEPITGYQLDAGGSFWGIIVPEEGTNLVRNPSFEVANGTEISIGGMTSAVFSSEQASRGFRSLKAFPSAASGNIQHTWTVTQAGLHTLSVDLWGHLGHRLFLQVVRDTEVILVRATITPQGEGWKRYSITYYDYADTGNNTRYARLRTDFFNPTTLPFYVDGWQIEQKGYPTTYIDGDLSESSFHADPYAYGWSGLAHQSPSTRSDRTYGGGRILSLHDIGFLTTSVMGLGLGNSSLDVATLFGGEEVLRSAWVAGKEFSIIGRLYGDGATDIQRRRQQLIDMVTTLNSRSGMVTLCYQPVNRRGIPIGKRLFIDCVFLGGMDYNFTNLYEDSIELRFRVFQGRLYEEFGSSAPLDIGGIKDDETGIYVRSVQTGEWENYLIGTSETTGGIVKCAVILNDGSLVVGGSFTAIGGVTARRVARFNPQTLLWEEYGNGLNGTVEQLAVGRGRFQGKLIAVGSFTSNGPGVTVIRRAAYWDTNLAVWVELGLGFNNTVHDVSVAPNGIILVGGAFTLNGPATLPMVKAAYGNGDTDLAPFAWSTIPTTATGDVFAVEIAQDGNFYLAGDFTDLNGNLNAKRIAFNIPGDAIVNSLGVGLSSTVYDIKFGLDGYLYAVGGFTATSDTLTVLRGFARFLGPIGGDGKWEEIGRGEIASTFTQLAFDRRGYAYVSGGQQVDGPYSSFSVTGLFQWTGSAWVPFDVRGVSVSIPTFGKFFLKNNGDFVLPVGNATGSLISGYTAVNYLGTADAPIKLQITGPAYLHRLSNWTNNTHIYFKSIVVAEDEILIVDLTGLGPRVSSNFYSDLSHQLLGAVSDLDSFRLQPGINHITLTLTQTDVLIDPVAVLAWNNRHFSIDAAQG